ncbi:MAG TPA: AAA family ATPase, partial [Myxococcaceae bacterium]|nr:AAA family ATPase [Myxococcaceae bacterium]
MGPKANPRQQIDTPTLIGFRPFRLDLRAGLLLRGDEPIALRPKTWSVLCCLVERAGQLITKRQLLEAVWGEVEVTESVLNNSIRELRIALGDSSKVPRFIETVSRRGFRFVALVDDLSATRGTQRSAASDASSAASAAADDWTPRTSDSPQGTLFVGRSGELRKMGELFTKARDGQRQIVFISGQAGIGKTALVEAFLGTLEGRQAPTHTRVARGFCVEQHGPREPYMPVLAALERLASLPDAGELGALLRRVAPTWLAQTPWLIEKDEAQALQQTLQFVRPERMLREFSVLVEALTDETPLVLVLEDLHWSDASTIDLLSVLGERTKRSRLLVIGTYRPAEAAVGEHPVLNAVRTLRAHRQCAELVLSDLPVEGVQDYLRARFPGNDFPSWLGRRIHQQTDGQPLFMVGVVDSLVSRGRIVDTAPGWALTVPSETVDLGVPDDVRLLIESQLDGLSPADRALLQAASVAGEDFSPLVVAAALGHEEPEVEARCETLVRTRR